jgi:hypothetical protein
VDVSDEFKTLNDAIAESKWTYKKNAKKDVQFPKNYVGDA